MHIVSLRLQLEITDGVTLKDKRQVIRSLLDRMRRFNVSAAEVGDNDSVRYATLAAVAVANDARFLDEMMAKLADLVEGEPRVAVMSREFDFV